MFYRITNVIVAVLGCELTRQGPGRACCVAALNQSAAWPDNRSARGIFRAGTVICDLQFFIFLGSHSRRPQPTTRPPTSKDVLPPAAGREKTPMHVIKSCTNVIDDKTTAAPRPAARPCSSARSAAREQERRGRAPSPISPRRSRSIRSRASAYSARGRLYHQTRDDEESLRRT